MKRYTVGACLIFALSLGAGYLVVSQIAKNSPPAIAKSFLEDIAQSKFHEAYSLTSADFKSHLSEQSFSQQLAGSRNPKTKIKVTGNVADSAFKGARIVYAEVDTGSTSHKVLVRVTPDSGHWRVGAMGLVQ